MRLQESEGDEAPADALLLAAQGNPKKVDEDSAQKTRCGRVVQKTRKRLQHADTKACEDSRERPPAAKRRRMRHNHGQPSPARPRGQVSPLVLPDPPKEDPEVAVEREAAEQKLDERLQTVLQSMRDPGTRRIPPEAEARACGDGGVPQHCIARTLAVGYTAEQASDVHACAAAEDGLKTARRIWDKREAHLVLDLDERRSCTAAWFAQQRKIEALTSEVLNIEEEGRAPLLQQLAVLERDAQELQRSEHAADICEQVSAERADEARRVLGAAEDAVDALKARVPLAVRESAVAAGLLAEWWAAEGPLAREPLGRAWADDSTDWATPGARFATGGGACGWFAWDDSVFA